MQRECRDAPCRARGTVEVHVTRVDAANAVPVRVVVAWVRAARGVPVVGAAPVKRRRSEVECGPGGKAHGSGAWGIGAWGAAPSVSVKVLEQCLQGDLVLRSTSAENEKERHRFTSQNLRENMTVS